MAVNVQQPPVSDIRAEQEQIRRELRRVNIAWLVIVLMLVALAFGFVWKARQYSSEAERANSEAMRARHATIKAEDELWNSRFNEVRRLRTAGSPGARAESEILIQQLIQRPALAREQTLGLRKQAISQLALADVIPATNWVPRNSHRSLAWDGDFRRLARINPTNKTFEVWSYPGQKLLNSFASPRNAEPHQPLLSPEGDLLVGRFHGGEVFVWEVESGKVTLETKCVRASNDISPLIPCPDGQTFGMFTTQGFVLHPFKPGSPPRIFNTPNIGNAVLRPDGKKLAVWLRTRPEEIEIWDVESGNLLQTVDAGFEVWTIEWHPDGRRLVLSGNGGRVGLWDLGTAGGGQLPKPREIVTFQGHVGAVVSTIIPSDGSTLLTYAWDSMSIMWDLVSGKKQLTETRLQLKHFSADGTQVLATSKPLDAEFHSEAPCAFRPSQVFQTVAWGGRPRALNGVWVNRDASLLAVAYPASQKDPRGLCSLWNFTSGVEIAQFTGIWGQFSPDGKYFYSFDITDLTRYELKEEYLSGKQPWPKGTSVLKAARGESINAGAITSDGQTMVVGAVSKIILCDLTGSAPPWRINQNAHDAALSPNGEYLASRFHNHPGPIRDLITGVPIEGLPDVTEFVFSPNGKWIIGRGSKQLAVLNANTLEIVRKLPVNVGSGVAPSVAFSPNGAMMAVAHNRFEVRLYELPDGEELATIAPPHPAQISASKALCFTSDGKWLVIGKEDGEIVRCNLAEMETELRALGLHWDQEKETTGAMLAGVAPAPLPKIASNHKPPSILDNTAAGAASAAVALALAGGLFLSMHQRKMLRAYAQAEKLAREQQWKLQRAQEELLRSEKMRALGTLSAGIAHDFNNLLSVIRLSNQLAEEQVRPSGQAQQNMDAVEAAVAEGEKIVQSMLGYSRDAAANKQPYSVVAAVSETVAMLGRKFLSGIILELDLPAELPMASGVRGRLEQMLLNLIVNASDAMNGQGKLRLAARIIEKPDSCVLYAEKADSYIEIEVSDSGPGIPPEILPRIFEPFFTTKANYEKPGSGLGLSTVYNMAEQDGLGLAVETELENGTTFRIYIPALSVPARRADLIHFAG